MAERRDAGDADGGDEHRAGGRDLRAAAGSSSGDGYSNCPVELPLSVTRLMEHHATLNSPSVGQGGLGRDLQSGTSSRPDGRRTDSIARTSFLSGFPSMADSLRSDSHVDDERRRTAAVSSQQPVDVPLRGRSPIYAGYGSPSGDHGGNVGGLLLTAGITAYARHGSPIIADEHRTPAERFPVGTGYARYGSPYVDRRGAPTDLRFRSVSPAFTRYGSPADGDARSQHSDPLAWSSSPALSGAGTWTSHGGLDCPVSRRPLLHVPEGAGGTVQLVVRRLQGSLSTQN